VAHDGQYLRMGFHQADVFTSVVPKMVVFTLLEQRRVEKVVHIAIAGVVPHPEASQVPSAVRQDTTSSLAAALSSEATDDDEQDSCDTSCYTRAKSTAYTPCDDRILPDRRVRAKLPVEGHREYSNGCPQVHASEGCVCLSGLHLDVVDWKL